MSEAGQKIIKALEDAAEFAKGDTSKGILWHPLRCGCCEKQFLSTNPEEIFCATCDPLPAAEL